MLMAIKNHFADVKSSNLNDICKRFSLSPDVARTMISHLVRKGYVVASQPVSGCGSRCNRCNPLMTEMYHWHQQASAPVATTACRSEFLSH